ncbi:MAG: transposase [Clostridiales bacterium]|nr:transposase [Clostridiales bacterium]
MKQYDTAFKREVCKRIVEDGEKVSALSEELGIHENTLYKFALSGKQREAVCRERRRPCAARK